MFSVFSVVKKCLARRSAHAPQRREPEQEQQDDGGHRDADDEAVALRLLLPLLRLLLERRQEVLGFGVVRIELDGALEDDELILWNRVYLAVGRPAPPDEAALCGVACAFRQQEIVDVALLDAALDDDDANDHAAVADFADSFWFRLRKLLLK